MYIFIESPYCYYYIDIESGFRVFIRVSCIRGFGFGRSYHPNRCSVRFRVSILGFGFREHIDFTRSEPAPLPSLLMSRYQDYRV